MQRITKDKSELQVAASFGKIFINHCYKERNLNHIVRIMRKKRNENEKTQ